MLSLLAAAPYAIGLAFFCFVYLIGYPYIEYLRDPKGMTGKTHSHDATDELTLCQDYENTPTCILSPASQPSPS